MRRILITLLLSLSLFSVKLSGEVPSSAIDQALKSVYLLTGQAEHGRYACTAWLVADEVAMTANHCAKDGAQIVVAGFPATEIDGVEYFDLAAFAVKGLHGTPLKVRTWPVAKFEQLAALGHAYGWQRPASFHTRVYFTNMSPAEGWCPGFLVKPGYIGGMSGGPSVDEAGFVVGVNLASNQDLGYSVGVPHILAFLAGIGL